MCSNTGRKRPDFAIEPGPGQESAWDYPRPPAIRRDNRLVEVREGETLIARSTSSYRVLETASPPTFYLPPADVDLDRLVEAHGTSICEWKGMAKYWALDNGPSVPIAWTYPRPRPRFEVIRDYVSFYPGRIDCFVDGARVAAQSGGFYGGWITAEIVGPFKGDPGTGHW
jgi:uncharacterized protein (DUF427 family)